MFAWMSWSNGSGIAFHAKTHKQTKKKKLESVEVKQAKKKTIIACMYVRN